MARVFIGVDPHKLSATIEVVDGQRDGAGDGPVRYRQGRLLPRCVSYVAFWPERVWAVEGSNGVGRPLAQRLLAEAGARRRRARRSSPPGSGCSTPATTARPMPTTRTRSRWSPCAPANLRVLCYDDELEALRMLVDRRDRARSATGADRQSAAALARRVAPRAGARRTSLPCRQRRFCPRCGHETWPGRRAAGSRSNSSPSCSRPTRRSRSSTKELKAHRACARVDG